MQNRRPHSSFLPDDRAKGPFGASALLRSTPRCRQYQQHDEPNLRQLIPIASCFALVRLAPVAATPKQRNFSPSFPLISNNATRSRCPSRQFWSHRSRSHRSHAAGQLGSFTTETRSARRCAEGRRESRVESHSASPKSLGFWKSQGFDRKSFSLCPQRLGGEILCD